MSVPLDASVNFLVGVLDNLEIHKIQTITELMCIKYGLISLPLFDVSHVDFMLEPLCTR